MNLIIRNDDVNPNTDARRIGETYSVIRSFVPDCTIWSCINFLGKTSEGESVYPELPLRNHPLDYFFDIDRASIRHLDKVDLGAIVSHGLLHVDHAKLSPDAQHMSIVTSCNYLKTKIFVPPFSSYNDDTEAICKHSGIHMTKPSDGWKSLESDRFDPRHKLWFFHSWRFTPEMMKEVFLRSLEAVC